MCRASLDGRTMLVRNNGLWIGLRESVEREIVGRYLPLVRNGLDVSCHTLNLRGGVRSGLPPINHGLQFYWTQ